MSRGRFDDVGVRWATPTAVCPDCRRRFKRWNASSGYASKSGAHYGCAYCRACQNKRCIEWQGRVVGSGVCIRCGCSFDVTNIMNTRHKHGRLSLKYCSQVCHHDDVRRWSDKREKGREKKRRERAALRARGLTANRTPYKPGRYFNASRVVPPTVALTDAEVRELSGGAA